LTQGAGHVLDVGRAARLATPAQRRGLAIRDGGCVGYECDRPPAWTDVHHVVPRSQGGLTDFDVLCLLCRRHHTLVHDDGWVCVRDGTGWIVLPPELARDRDRDRDTAPPDTAITPTAAGTSASTATRGRPVTSERLHRAVPYCPTD
ncbi:MAG: endonuclease, partial [Frankiales bacterium]|nr:endonuclease [Frankiales bacterium]